MTLSSIRFRRSLLAALLLGATSCETVEFYERAAFTDPTMQVADDPASVHFEQKVVQSTEGAVGGIGSAAGGGCGCY